MIEQIKAFSRAIIEAFGEESEQSRAQRLNNKIVARENPVMKCVKKRHQSRDI